MSDLIQQIRDTYSTDKAAVLNMLPELFQAADGGKIVELPCKPGEVLYVNSGCLFSGGDDSYTPCEVVNVRLGKKGGWRIYLRPRVNREIGHYHVIFPASAIGITIFQKRH